MADKKLIDIDRLSRYHENINTLLVTKQESLVSGDNIKTINGESILGSGNITIEGEHLTESDIAAMGFTKNTGTITGVSANGTSVATSGVVNIPAASISAYGVTKLSSAINSNSTTLAATASAVKAAYDLANGKQDELVSGINIKTINGTSLLGSGDIVISVGEGDYLPSTGGVIDGDLVVMGTITSPTLIVANGGIQGYLRRGDYILGLDGFSKDIVWGTEADEEYHITAKGDGTKFLSDDGTYKTISGGSSSGAYSEVNHGTSDTTLTLTPNTFHIWDEVTNLTLTFESETAGVANEFLFQFTSGATATTLSLPSDLKWSEELVVESNKIYQVSILKGLASVLSWDNAPNLIENHITYNEGNFMNGATITFEYPTASEIVFAMDYYSSSELVIPQGTTNMTIDWFEPQPPTILNIIPSEDSIYKYILS